MRGLWRMPEADGTSDKSATITGKQRDDRGRLLPGNPTAWKPGMTGNPSGRPSTEREVTLAARALVLEGVATLADVMRNKRAPAVARVRAVEVLLERGYGKAPQRVIVETDVGGMTNGALANYMRGQLEQVARTIEHEPDEVET